MLDILNLAAPFFGLIFIGYACGRLNRMPDSGLAWMNVFIIYVALPALFYRIIAVAPLEQVVNLRFIAATTFATFCAFALAFIVGMVLRRGDIAGATIAALAGAYGNTGYMGPGLAFAVLGPEAAVPVALIFCFETILLFSLAPFLMALAGIGGKTPGVAALEVIRRIALHPFIIATAAGVASAAIHFQPPAALDRLLAFLQNAAAPCALFALGVTVALRPLRHMDWEVPVVVAIKLVAHPVLALALLSAVAPQPELWVYTAVLMASLPPALNVFILARQYDTCVPQASSAILLGTLVSVATVTTVMWLVKSRTLPTVLFP